MSGTIENDEEQTVPQFERYSGIDYSGAKTPTSSLPGLRFIRERCRDRVPFWPFEGWEIPAGRSVLAEVYPSL